MSEIKGRYQVSLCRARNCCPQLIIENDQYIITDDFGGKVVLDDQQMNSLLKEYREYREMQSLKGWNELI